MHALGLRSPAGTFTTSATPHFSVEALIDPHATDNTAGDSAQKIKPTRCSTQTALYGSHGTQHVQQDTPTAHPHIFDEAGLLPWLLLGVLPLPLLLPLLLLLPPLRLQAIAFAT